MGRILLLGIAFTLVACGSSEPVGLPSDIAGAYQITTLDGSNLPVTVLDLGAYQVAVISGSLSLGVDGAYSLDINYRILDSGNVRSGGNHDSGLWNYVNRGITLSSTAGDISRMGTVSGNTITLESGSRVIRLSK